MFRVRYHIFLILCLDLIAIQSVGIFHFVLLGFMFNALNGDSQIRNYSRKQYSAQWAGEHRFYKDITI